MQEHEDAWKPTQTERNQCLLFPRSRLSILVVIIVGIVLLQSDFVPHWGLSGSSRHVAPRFIVGVKTIVLNGANHWIGDRTITAPAFDFSPSDNNIVGVSPLFEHYYTGHAGATGLGNPVTVAFPTQQGWIQFFTSGALLLSIAQRGQTTTRATSTSFDELIDAGTTDASSGIIHLPLLQALLTTGSQVPIGGDGSHFTYVDLRKATNPDLMLSGPTVSRVGPSSISLSQEAFIKGGTRKGSDVGHLIPLPFWRYINRPDISPDGWEAEFGVPLTEALPLTVVKDGSEHHLLVQAFSRDGLILDQDTLDASGQPQIQRLDTGIAYLRTIGPPPVAIHPQQTIWATKCSGAPSAGREANAQTAQGAVSNVTPCGYHALLNAPSTGQPIAHVGQSFPLALLGDTTWKTGMLWYHVQWSVPNGISSGWVAASSISFSLPKNVPAHASFDVLSTSLADYLAQLGSNVNAVVYDVTHKRYYAYNANAQSITGSSMKVAILLTFLDMTERQGRDPDDNEMNLLITMIENSDNDSASALYYGEIGGAAGVASFMHSIGVSGLDPNADAWGYSLITPKAMVKLLTLLYEGKILTEHDRTLALSLMENIEADQQVGVGDTAPQSALVAMKDGWLPGPDGLWAFNSSGIVISDQETYIISVYTQEQNSLDDGHAIVRHICATVSSLLI